MNRRGPGLRVALAAVIAVALLAAGAVALAAPPPLQEPLPPPPPDAGLERPLYDDVPLDHYGIDADYSYSDVAARQVHLLLTSAMVARAWLVKLAIRIAEQALTLRPAGALAQAADQIAAQLGDALWGQDFAGPLVLAGLMAAGAWAMLLWLRRPGTAWRSLLGTALALAVAVAALLSLGGILRALGEVSADLARLAFTAATQPIAGTGSAPAELRAVTAAGSAAWDTLVHQPWLDGQFTDRNAARQYAARDVPGLALLQLTTEERLELYTSLPLHQRERLFAPWQVNRLPGRAVTALAAGLAALIYAVAVLALAGAMLMYDLLLVVLAAVTPAAALLALWPPWGSRLAAAWAGRLLGAALGKAIAALLLGAFFSISVAVLEVSEPGGWTLAALLHAVLAVALWRARSYMLERASTVIPRTQISSPGAISVRRGDRQAATVRADSVPVSAGATPVTRFAMVTAQSHSAAPVPRPQSVLVPLAPAQLTHPRHELTMEMTRLRQQLVLSSMREHGSVRAPVHWLGRHEGTAVPPAPLPSGSVAQPKSPTPGATLVVPVPGGTARVRAPVNVEPAREASRPERRPRQPRH